MKKSRLLSILLVGILLVIGVVATACGSKNPQNEEPPEVVTGNEVGVYYFDAGDGEYLLSLTEEGKVSLTMSDIVAVGTYTRDGNTITLNYESGGIDDMTVTINNAESEITVTYNGKAMVFLRRVTYKVSFDTYLGSKVEPVEVLNGKTLSAPQPPTREGYVFVGWYKDSSYKMPFAFDSERIGANLTLYAQWIERKAGEQVFTISFDAGDYAGAPKYDSEKTAAGKLYGVEMKTPTREGYEFKGWWYSVSGKADELTYKVNADTVYYENTTLYAVWQGAKKDDKLQEPVVDVVDGRISWELVTGAVEYKVVVTDENNNTVIERSMTATSTNLNVDKPGSYTVTVTAVSGISESNNSETTRRYNYMVLSRVSLFEVLNDRVLMFNEVANATNYKLKIDCGDVSHSHNPRNFIFEFYNNGANTTFDFGTCPMQKDGILFTVIAEAEGYASSESEAWSFDRLLTAIAQGSLKYDAATETISWDAVEGATGYEVTVGDNAAVTVGGTSFDIRSYASGSVKVSVSPVAYGYNSPEATEITVNKATLAAPVNVRMDGNVVKWDGVATAEKYVVEIGGKSFDVTGATELDLGTVSVDWNKNTDYTVTVKAQKGTSSSLASLPVEVYYQRMGKLTYEAGKVSWGYVYGATGYDVRVNGGEETRVSGTGSAEVALTQAGDNDVEVRFVKGTEVSSWEKVTVYAYELAYDLNGASGLMDAQYYAEGDPVRLYENTDVKNELTGHSFNGWYTTGGQNGQRYDYSVYNMHEDTVLYANWKPRTYKLTLNYNNGGAGITEWEVVFGRPFELPLPTDVFDGTTLFGGWCANAIGTAASYTDELGHSVMNWNIAANTEIFAKWLSVYKFEKKAGGSAGFYYTLLAGDAKKPINIATIPATYKAPGDSVAYPVTQIGTTAFSSCEGVQVINLPSSIDTILPLAFESYTTLREINVYQAEGVTNNTYWSQDGVLFYNNSTAGTVELWAMPRAFTGDKNGKYTLPNRVTNIPTRAFYHTDLSELAIPASVNYIVTDAFYMTDILAVKFLSAADGESSNTLRLEIGAFHSASKLEEVTLPAHDFVVWNAIADSEVADFDFKVHVFPGCSKLRLIDVDENNQTYQNIEGLLCTKGVDTTLVYCPVTVSGKLTIPVGIVRIGKNAFANCRSITEIVIPNWVKSIDDSAFNGFPTKPDGVTYDVNVYGCSELKKVTFAGGDGLAAELTIGKDAFGSKTFTTLYYCSKLSTVVFENGSGVTEIGEYAFARCPITSIIFPATLSDVREGAFYSCTSLKTVEYAPNGQNIALGNQVFANCTAFTTVKLPANVTEFSDGVFAGCINLANIEVDPQNPTLASIDGVLFSKDETEILFYPFGKQGNYQIPESVTRISGGAFSGKENIVRITIGKNVTYIGAGAFRNCVNLESVTFEEGGTEELVIGASAFNSCEKLTEFRLSERVKEIPDRMLFYASRLAEVYIPASVKRIGDYAFYSLGRFLDEPIAKITVPSSVTEIGLAAFSACKFKEIEFEDLDLSNGATLQFAVAEEEIKQSSIGSETYLDEYNPYAFTVGEAKVFYNCSVLEKITLAEGLVNMPGGMFQSCKELTEVVIPGSVTRIGASVFNGCSSIKTIIFAERTPDEDGNYTELVLEDGTSGDVSTGDHGETTTYYYGVFFGCTGLETVVFPEGLTRIPNYTFSGCTGLKRVVVPSTVRNDSFNPGSQKSQPTAIGDKAFYNCTALTTVEFASGGTGDFSLGACAFENCTSLESITLPSRLADYKAYYKLTDTVQYGPFTVCGIRTALQVRDFTTTGNISYYEVYNPSFKGCTNLKEINVYESETEKGAYYSSDDGIVYTADKTEMVFVAPGRSKNIEVPYTVNFVRSSVFFVYQYDAKPADYVKEIRFLEVPEGEQTESDSLVIGPEVRPFPVNTVTQGNAEYVGAFAKSRIETVYFPKRLKAINVFAFYNCPNLKNVYFADDTDKFTVIDYNAFNGCGNLQAINLPDSVTEIGENGFINCKSMSDFTIDAENSKLANIGKKAFYGTGITAVALPPAQSFKVGESAFASCTKLTTVRIPNTLTSFSSLFTGSYAITTIDIYKVEGATGGLQGDPNDPDSGVVFTDGGKTLAYYPIGKTDTTYVVPVGVTKIDKSAFSNNGYIEHVIIPNTVEIIDDFAFHMCVNLRYVEFEKDDVVHYVKLTDNEKESYAGDRYTKSGNDDYVLDADGDYKIAVAATTLKIGTGTGTQTTSSSVFGHSINLQRVDFPARLQSIAPYALFYCVNLTTVTFDAGCQLGELTRGIFNNTDLRYGGTREQIAENPQHEFELPSSLSSIAEHSSIEYNAFGSVTKLKIPASVTSLGNYAFFSCQALVEVEFLGDYTNSTQKLTLGTNLFKDCPNLTTVKFPEGLTTINTLPFVGCPNMASVNIPSTVTSIGNSAFKDLSNIAFTIPNGVTTIGNSAFENCTALCSDTASGGKLDISKATTIGTSAFKNCVNITSIDVSSATKIDNNAFEGCINILGYAGSDGKLSIPKVKTLGSSVFTLNENIVSVDMTDITSIGGSAFKGCVNLEKITSLANVTTLSNNAFEGCTKLFSDNESKGAVDLSGVKSIGGSAFLNCTSLKKVKLAANLTTVSASAFAGCTNLALITYDDANTEYDLYVPSTTTTFGASAFAGTAITKAYIPSSVKSLSACFNLNPLKDDGTEQYCTQLTKVIFETNNANTMTSIPANMFAGLTALEEVTLPENTKLITISAGAFAYSGIKKITIPANIKNVNAGAFAGCYRLQQVDFEENSKDELKFTAGSSDVDSLTKAGSLGVFAFSGAENARPETIGEKDPTFTIDMSKRKIVTITKYTFCGIKNLDIKFSADTTTISTLSFPDAAIDELEIPSTVTTIQIAAFAKSKIKAVKFTAPEAGALTKLTLPAGTSTNTDTTLGVFAYSDELTAVDMSGRIITEIPKYAFYRCPKIAEIKWSVATAATETEPMTSNTTTIGEAAFQYSCNMEELDVPRGVTKIENWGFWGSTIGRVKLPNTLTSLGYGAFYEVSTLESVEFEANSQITTFVDRSGQAWTFGYNPDLKTVVLPDSLITIPANAFYNTGLTSVTIPKSVVTIGNYAFATNPDLMTVIFEKDADGSCALTTLGNGAFNKTAITAIEIPRSVTSIGDYAFQYSPLTSVTFEKGGDGTCALTSIGSGAFGSTAITSFEIPKSVTTLGANPFRYCSDLASLTVEAGSENFTAENNVLYNIGKTAVYAYTAGVDGEYVIPDTVVYIGAYAFAGTDFAGVLNSTADGFYVGAYAFYETGITSVTLGSDATVGESAFEGTSVTSVTLGAGASLADYAFSECASLTSATLGSGAYIGNMAFENCVGLTEFTLPEDSTLDLMAFTGSGVTLTDEMIGEDTTLKYGGLNLYRDGTMEFRDVSSAVEALKANPELEYVKLAEGVTSIDNNAFKGIENLKKIILPSTLTSIGDYAFDGCTSLATVEFTKDADGNSKLTTIGQYAFRNTGITQVKIPKSVTTVKNYAFYGNASLTKVEFESGSGVDAFWGTTSKATTTSTKVYTFAECPELTTVVLPDGLVHLGACAFQNSGLTSISVPSTVVNIWQSAFEGCTSLASLTFEKDANGNCAFTTFGASAFRDTALTDVSLPATTKTMGTSTFYGCASLTSVTFEKNAAGSYALTKLADSAFAYSGITSITLPYTFTEVTIKSFQGCADLTTVIFEKDANGNCSFAAFGNYAFAESGITEIAIPKTYNCTGTSSGTYVFNNCKDLTTVTFERDENGDSKFNTLPQYMFVGSGITSISIPGNVKTLGTNVFQDCASLESVTFEKSSAGTYALTAISNYAFAGSGLKSVTIPYVIATINQYSFYGCPNLTSVEWGKDDNGSPNPKITISAYAFGNCASLKHMVFPSTVVLYKEAIAGFTEDQTIYFIELPGPRPGGTSPGWSTYKWYEDCAARLVWRWSEDMGFLNENGEFENEAA